MSRTFSGNRATTGAIASRQTRSSWSPSRGYRLLDLGQGLSRVDPRTRRPLGIDEPFLEQRLQIAVRNLPRHSRSLRKPRPDAVTIGGDQFQGLPANLLFVNAHA